MQRTVTFKLRSRRHTKLAAALETCRFLYNAALEQRRLAYQRQHKYVSLWDQSKDLTELRAAEPQYGGLSVEMLRYTVLRRLDCAFKEFFRRCKTGVKPGFPRFRGKGRFDTLVFGPSGWTLYGKRLRIKGIGTFTVRGPFDRLRGVKKGLRLVRHDNCWEAQILLDIGPAPAVKASINGVGIDVGIRTFATLSDGKTVEHPRFLKKAVEQLTKAQQALSRKKKGSSRYKAAKLALARVHHHIKNRRRDFTHKTSRWLINNYDGFAIEKLNIQKMLQQSPDELNAKQSKGLHRGIMDSAWSNHAFCLGYKAEEAGSPKVEVNARGTSRKCSGCGTPVRKTLKDRIHRCPACGLEIDRDLNAALNIYACGTQAAPDMLRRQCPG